MKNTPTNICTVLPVFGRVGKAIHSVRIRCELDRDWRLPLASSRRRNWCKSEDNDRLQGEQRLYVSLIARRLSGFLLHVNKLSYDSPLTALAPLIHSVVTERSP